jgi:NTP pyrophosphatase (non-canonical NTP hydrolase)
MINRHYVNEYVQISYDNAVEKGWHEQERSIGDLIALMHSELSEALEEYRNGRTPTEVYYNPDKPRKPEGIPIELADCVIRIFDFCGKYGIDLEEALNEKIIYNKSRPHRHGGKKV